MQDASPFLFFSFGIYETIQVWQLILQSQIIRIRCSSHFRKNIDIKQSMADSEINRLCYTGSCFIG